MNESEVQYLLQLARQRGAQLQILWHWMHNLQLLFRADHPEVERWFDDNGVPVEKELKDTCVTHVPPSQATVVYGWICPQCGRGNAPFTATCPCVPPPPMVVTCGTSVKPQTCCE